MTAFFNFEHFHVHVVSTVLFLDFCFSCVRSYNISVVVLVVVVAFVNAAADLVVVKVNKKKKRKKNLEIYL